MASRIETDFELIPFDSVDYATEGDPETSIVARASTLRPPVRYGVCLWWSENFPFIHPQDVEIAESFIPGTRVFRRDLCDNVSDQELGYWKLEYGQTRFRVRPLIWMEVKSEGFEIFDMVEVLSQQGRRTPGIAEVAEIKWNRRKRRIEYELRQNGRMLTQRFLAEDIQPATRLGSHLSERMLRLQERIQ